VESSLFEKAAIRDHALAEDRSTVNGSLISRSSWNAVLSAFVTLSAERADAHVAFQVMPIPQFATTGVHRMNLFLRIAPLSLPLSLFSTLDLYSIVRASNMFITRIHCDLRPFRRRTDTHDCTRGFYVGFYEPEERISNWNRGNYEVSRTRLPRAV